MNCIKHPDKIATHTKLSYFKGNLKRLPICADCESQYKRNYPALYNALEIQPVEILAVNVFQCSICQGIVDRYEHCFICRNCGAMEWQLYLRVAE